MTNVVLCSDHYYNYPICGQECQEEQEPGYKTPLRVQGPCHVFLCHNPLANDPLHYYNHIIERSQPTRLAFQEFSLDLGNKSVLFANNFLTQKLKSKIIRTPPHWN